MKKFYQNLLKKKNHFIYLFKKNVKTFFNYQLFYVKEVLYLKIKSFSFY